MTKQIQLFKPIFNKEEVLAQIGECLDRGWTGNGYKTIEFEEKFKAYTNIPNAHFTNSATSALHLALELIKKNDDPDDYKTFVITSPLTFISDSHVIKHAGYDPNFIDVDNSLCMDPIKLEKELSINTYNILAVIYTGIGGNTGKLSEIVDICRTREIPLILDASHMMGTYYNGCHVGNEGQDYTVFSFQSVKNLPTADSGMLCCRKLYDDKLARKLSWLGISRDTYDRQVNNGNWDYDVVDVGWKYHGNSIMAAMGIVGLASLGYHNQIRRLQAEFYDANIINKEFIHIPTDSHCISSRHLYQLLVGVQFRDSIISYMRENGIQLGVHYKSHLKHSIYKDDNYHNTPYADLYSQQLISLPIGPHLSEDDVSYIVETMNEYKF